MITGHWSLVYGLLVYKIVFEKFVKPSSPTSYVLNVRSLRDVGNLFNTIAFNQSINEDYYKPIRTKSGFKGNYTEYESKKDKKNCQNMRNILNGQPTLRYHGRTTYI